MDLLERTSTHTTRHPWEIARSRFFLRLLQRLAPMEAPTHLLDVGSGDAWLAQQVAGTLPAASSVTCWDANYAPDDVVSHPSLLFTKEHPVGTFDGVLMLDIIEHVEDDRVFVTDVVNTCMKDESWALVSVPAYQCLYTSHDTALRHFRRYSPQTCAQVLHQAGLDVQIHGGLFHSLLAARSVQKVREHVWGPRDSHGVGAWEGGPFLTRAVTAALDVEAKMSLGLGTRAAGVLPGLTYWAFCRRAT
jgi:methyltransferase family protein